MSDISRAESADGYRVPRRFSIAEILAMMTLFGLLFAGLRCFGASEVLYLFLSTQAVVICLVQMKFGGVPRGASTLVGCVFLPVWVCVLAAAGSRDSLLQFDSSWWGHLLAAPFGGLLGYCTGTMMAGVFLVMDKSAEFVQRAARRRARWP